MVHFNEPAVADGEQKKDDACCGDKGLPKLNEIHKAGAAKGDNKVVKHDEWVAARVGSFGSRECSLVGAAAFVSSSTR